MLDADLSELYGVSTKALNQAAKRNRNRFPEDFMFRLTASEKAEVVTNCDHLARPRFSPALPFAFTEHGALMLGNMLRAPRAVQVSLLIVRAFVRLRALLAANIELAGKLDELESKVAEHDEALARVVDAIRQLALVPRPIGGGIGFTANTPAQGQVTSR